MNIKQQRGFALFEVLFFVLLAAVIVGGAYYVGTRNNKSDNSTVTSSKSSTSQDSSSSTADWLTFSDDGTKYPKTPGNDGNEAAFSFRYPTEWKFYPIGTKVKTSNGDTAELSYNQVVPSGGQAGESGLAFNSLKTSLNAEEQYKKDVGDQSQLVGPVWQGVKSFTTEKGYSGYIARLDRGSGKATYSVNISNNKAVVIFSYGSETSKYHGAYEQIFNTVVIP
ncbi:hypothetical protein COU91_03355 [Candidatus Saccharibacteria bacterium CG10_big_fil_rev_8_21_14_0_10_47_8]|nr:MAG: hypothetical protein COU91_03355 [Candidatus Saccharibacteria bacterium CG10_big_fil_rev_8_21_14_0_10_47_8]